MTDTPTPIDPDTAADAAMVIARLRDLADYLDSRPTIAAAMKWSTYDPQVFPHIKDWTTVLREAGKFTKDECGDFLEARITINDDLTLVLNQRKDNTCEKIQVGVETVTKEQPIGDVEYETVSIEQPVYEWVCPESWLNGDAS